MQTTCFSTLLSLAWLSIGNVTLADDLQPLRESLTFHASFDDGLEADFSRGDKACLRELSESIRISESNGRFGNSLHFTTKSPAIPIYCGNEILNYRPEAWNTTVSVWLRLNPDLELNPGYCDPVQIVGDDFKKGFVFLEWSKDDTPRHFRYAMRPLFPIWNPKNLKWDEIPAQERPMVELVNAPFATDRWTHVVFTVANANDKSQRQSGRLYLNGEACGEVQGWDLTFGWDPAQMRLALGASYIGHMDDLSVFDRPLNDTEVKLLYNLESGAAELH